MDLLGAPFRSPVWYMTAFWLMLATYAYGAVIERAELILQFPWSMALDGASSSQYIAHSNATVLRVGA